MLIELFGPLLSMCSVVCSLGTDGGARAKVMGSLRTLGFNLLALMLPTNLKEIRPSLSSYNGNEAQQHTHTHTHSQLVTFGRLVTF